MAEVLACPQAKLSAAALPLEFSVNNLCQVVWYIKECIVMHDRHGHFNLGLYRWMNSCGILLNVFSAKTF